MEAQRAYVALESGVVPYSDHPSVERATIWRSSRERRRTGSHDDIRSTALLNGDEAPDQVIRAIGAVGDDNQLVIILVESMDDGDADSCR